MEMWAKFHFHQDPPATSLQGKADSCKIWNILDLPKEKPFGTNNSFRNHDCP